MPTCSAYGCTKRGSFAFPKDQKTRRQWEIALKRENFVATKHSILCRDHFVEEDFEEAESFHHGTKRRRLRKDAIPSVFCFKPPPNPTRRRRLQKRMKQKESLTLVCTERVGPTNDYEINEQEVDDPDAADLEGDVAIPDVAAEVLVLADEDVALGRDNCPEEKCSNTEEYCRSPEEEFEDSIDVDENVAGTSGSAKRSLSPSSKSRTCQCCEAERCVKNERVLMHLKDFEDDAEGIHFYTGLENYEKCMLVFQTLCPEAFDLNYKHKQVIKVPVEDQFFLTLMKLRRCTTDYELARFFGCCKKTVSNIFVTWIYFMSEMWAMLDIWPEKDLIEYYMPAGFKKDFSSTRVIIDGTEVPIQKPNNAKSQQATFSHYKNRCTLKVLVGGTPGGLISYCSDAYGGSTSDRAIVERSDLLDKCEEGDTIMADRGFVVNDLCSSRGIGLNMPTFMKGKSQLPSTTVIKDRKKASKRVHIERLIGLVKTYKIVRNELDRAYVPLGSKIFGVTIMLTNFRHVIMNRDA